MIERLVQAGLVQRSETPGDRRVRLVHLTAAGQQVVMESVGTQQAWLQPVLASLTAEQRAAVSQALRVLTAQAARLEPQQSHRETT
jgi:DNA-binding MarR family transcriptional regulator